MLSFRLYIVSTFWLTVAPAWPVCLYILYIVCHIQSHGLGGHGDAEICSAHIKRGLGEAGLS